ncbi:hypothetical protein NLU13_6592 [Sarocladium strictum]|uniref:GCN5-related N-acetyltransferase Rv2170-like domain-containing protein n=1 Tax=Sarocladium strictum TaxID=5046 RepID=A0AA39GGT0_SARSR|nr:hypothetical protein NLU13_6592 [Sarocladium strictum]
MIHQTTVHSKLPVPSTVIQRLERHLPFSLPVLRRLQSASSQAQDGKYYRVIVSAYCRHPKSEEDMNMDPLDVPFTMAFVELGARPDTQLWVYSTFEDVPDAQVSETVDMYRSQMRSVVAELKALREEYRGENAFGQSVLMGSAHSPRVMGLLRGYNRLKEETAGTYDKWLFRLENLPVQTGLPDDLTWNNATEEDCQVAMSHATVPLPLETLATAPNLFIKTAHGEPVCWGFLARDGSLIYLHCKESHRQKGLAKSLVSKLFRENIPHYGNDGWASADVHPENTASRALCSSLGGKPHWQSSCLKCLGQTGEVGLRVRGLSLANGQRLLIRALNREWQMRILAWSTCVQKPCSSFACLNLVYDGLSVKQIGPCSSAWLSSLRMNAAVTIAQSDLTAPKIKGQL